MCWGFREWIYRNRTRVGETRFEREHPLLSYGIFVSIFVAITIGGLICRQWIASGIISIITIIAIILFIKEYIELKPVIKGKSEQKRYEKYYFCNDELVYLRKKYYYFFWDYLAINECFNGNEELSDDKRVAKQCEKADKLYEYLCTNKTAHREFSKAYNIEIQPELSEIVLQSIMADWVIRLKRYTTDIFLSKESVLYLDGEYPANYQFFKDGRDKNVLDHIKFIKKIEDGLKDVFD